MKRGLASVLIVDDRDADLLATSRLLESAGIAGPHLTAADGDAAKRILAEKGPSICVVFLDLRMPDVDGLMLLTWVREQPNLAHLKIVMITGDDDPEHIDSARRRGADGYFTKYPSAPKLAAILSGIAPELFAADRA